MPRANADARFVWLLVWIIALLVRLGAAFILPNAEQDGYSYAETIADWSAKISSGQFHLVDLFGFWLPLFQFAGAIVDLVVRDPLLSGKLISSIAGAISCVLVFGLTKRLTGSRAFALLAFALILLNPLHLLYSAACMTDIPFGCLALAIVWFVHNERWTPAAVCAALAGFVRLEGWIFVAVLPVMEFLVKRRISWRTMSILLLPPLLWLLISHAATGDWLGYFAKRSAYQLRYLDSHPTRRGFAIADVVEDVDYFLFGANVFVILAVPLSIFRKSKGLRAIVASNITIVALLAFLLLAYIPKAQPVILPRYALVFFALALPVFVSLLQTLPRIWAAIPVILALHVFVRQLLIIPKAMLDFRAQELIAQTLVQDIGDARCFTDDVAVRVLSHLPPDRFLRTENTPASAATNATAFTDWLREQHADLLVFIRTEDSLPVRFFPDLDRGQTKIDIVHFQSLGSAWSPFGPSIFLYRLRDF